STEITGDSVGQIRMKLPVNKLGKGVVKEFFQSFVPLVTRPFSITVTHQDLDIIESILLQFLMHRYAKFIGEIIEHPYVVIACKNLNIHTGIFQLCQFTQKTNISPGDIIPVFKPVVKQVTKQKNVGGVPTSLIKPSNDFFFSGSAMLYPQVKIGGKING